MPPKRKTASQTMERELRSEGYRFVAGIDEAGRGPLAGPVCAAVVMFEGDVRIPGVYDSKELEPELREELFDKITKKASAVGIGLACAEEIDHLNILRATKLAARRALRNMPIMPDYLLLDALNLEKVTVPQRGMPKGDSRCFSIAAASIVAKVTRDRLMTRCGEEFPGYGFENHKGYGTPTHRRRIAELGPSSLHRQTFLEQWFGTVTMQYSRQHRLHHERMLLCEAIEEIHEMLEKLKDHKDWLPVTEWNLLTDLARKRCREISERCAEKGLAPGGVGSL